MFSHRRNTSRQPNKDSTETILANKYTVKIVNIVLGRSNRIMEAITETLQELIKEYEESPRFTITVESPSHETKVLTPRSVKASSTDYKDKPEPNMSLMNAHTPRDKPEDHSSKIEDKEDNSSGTKVIKDMLCWNCHTVIETDTVEYDKKLFCSSKCARGYKSRTV